MIRLVVGTTSLWLPTEGARRPGGRRFEAGGRWWQISRPEALDRRDRAAVGLLGRQPGLIEQAARDHAVHELQHRRHQLRLRGQQQSQRDRQ
jgi:hypothetical protein